jgi:hypothetical protein
MGDFSLVLMKLAAPEFMWKSGEIVAGSIRRTSCSA